MRFFVGILSSLAALFLFVASFAAQGDSPAEAAPPVEAAPPAEETAPPAEAAPPTEAAPPVASSTFKTGALPLDGEMIISAKIEVIETVTHCSLIVNDLYFGEYTYNKHWEERKLKPEKGVKNTQTAKITATCDSLPEDISPPRIIIQNATAEDHQLVDNMTWTLGTEKVLQGKLTKEEEKKDTIDYSLSFSEGAELQGNDLVIGRITSKEETITITGKLDMEISGDIESGTYKDTLQIELKL